MNWIKIADQLPPERKVVQMKIEEGGASRNEAPLKRIGRLYWLPDGSMYVYYTPTHWRILE